MKKILIIIQFILLHSLHAEIYQDRILVYIDNSIEDFDLNEDLFILAEDEIKRIEKNDFGLSKYKTLMKLYDQADVINDIV